MPVSKPPEAKKVRRDVELDETDREILRILAADARTPNNVLAAHVGLAASTCLMRVRRLQDTGVIRGFHADLAPEALGLPLQAIVSVRLQPNARPGIGSFARRFAALPGVLNVFFLAGVNDFQIHLAARSADDLRDFVVRNLSASRDVASTETNLIFEHIQGTALTATHASFRTSRGAASGLRRDQRDAPW
jgi:DNA-binding Lrp family transcriptional regulator